MKAIVLLSGKRKSGKDFVADRLAAELRAAGRSVVVIRLSEPLKREFARINNLNFTELLSPSQYKEKFRADMVIWGEEIRRKDEGYFCRLAFNENSLVNSSEICIVADCRRQSDLKHFQKFHSDEKISVLKIRIESDELTRRNRGWTFVNGVDDAETECGLDGESEWNSVLPNNDGDQTRFETIFDELKQKLHKLCDS